MDRSVTRRATALIAAAATLATFGALASTNASAAPAGKPEPKQHATVDPTLVKREVASRHDASTKTSRAALSQVQAHIAGYVTSHGTKYTFGSFNDPNTGAVVIETNAPASVTRTLTKVDRSAASATISVKKTGAISDQFNRRDDIPSFWGGNGLLATNLLCSAGYAVQTSSGYRYMVTAGHCFDNGVTVNTESNARREGIVTGRLLASLGGGPRDMELMYAESYAGRTYNGGVTSTTSNPVVSAGTAVVGYNAYCHSGRTTGEQCGHTATSITAQVCTQTGCKSPVIAFTGGNLTQGGDSGGTFYAKDSSGNVYVRGHVIAGGGSTSYAERWDKVASAYGVTIVTG